MLARSRRFTISNSLRAILQDGERRPRQAPPHRRCEHRGDRLRDFGGKHRPPEPQGGLEHQRTKSNRPPITSPREFSISTMPCQQPPLTPPLPRPPPLPTR